MDNLTEQDAWLRAILKRLDREDFENGWRIGKRSKHDYIVNKIYDLGHKGADAMHKGIFWVIADTESELSPENIIVLSTACDKNGKAEYCAEGAVEEPYNHKRVWARLSKKVTKGKPFDYYPRGRAEIKNGKATLWLSPVIADMADMLIRRFGLSELGKENVTIKVDGSEHYKCHFDKEKP